MRLTPDQKRILLVLCNQEDHNIEEGGVGGQSVKLVHQANGVANPIRENNVAMALVRKELVESVRPGRFRVTAEGYWLGDGLRIEDRLGKIPDRRRP